MQDSYCTLVCFTHLYLGSWSSSLWGSEAVRQWFPQNVCSVVLLSSIWKAYLFLAPFRDSVSHPVWPQCKIKYFLIFIFSCLLPLIHFVIFSNTRKKIPLLCANTFKTIKKFQVISFSVSLYSQLKICPSPQKKKEIGVFIFNHMLENYYWDVSFAITLKFNNHIQNKILLSSNF